MYIAPPRGTVRLPRGVADRGGTAGYVRASDGIERLNLQSGERLWTTGLAQYPVGLWQAQLVAVRFAPRPAEMQIVTLDPERPADALVSSEPIPVPAWAVAAPDRLSLDAAIEGDHLTVAWASQTAYEGGAPPPPEIERAAARSAAGAARVNLNTGAVQPAIPPSDARSAPAELSESRNGEWYSSRWLAGSESVQTVLTDLDGRQRLSLQFGTADRAGERVVLMEGTALVGLVTLDGEHVIVRDEGGGEAAPDAVVFSIPARASIGAITWEPGTGEATVLGDRVVYLVRRIEHAATPHSLGAAAVVLCARVLQGDRMLWEHQLERIQTGPRQVRPRM